MVRWRVIPASDTHVRGEELGAGERVGRYRVLRTLGVGGCATVYAAEDAGRLVAVKVLHSLLSMAPKMVERFAREVRAAMRVRHAGIVEIFEMGQLADGRPWYAMELVDGEDLESRLWRRGRLSARDALAVLEPVCAALQAAHEVGLVHRDLKAANVLVGAGGIKLGDFGIAKLIEPDPRDEQLTTVGRQVGTPVAMAPEQLRGQPVDARTDVYGLGVLTFYVLTRRYPFDFEDPAELEAAHLHTAPPRPSRFATVPRAVDAVVLRCLEKRPEARFPSVADFIAELRRAVAPDRGAAPPLRTPAVALLVEARVPPRDLDDDEADELAAGLELAVERLSRAGLRTVLETSISVVAASPVPTGRDLEMRGRAAALAVDIYMALRAHGRVGGVRARGRRRCGPRRTGGRWAGAAARRLGAADDAQRRAGDARVRGRTRRASRALAAQGFGLKADRDAFEVDHAQS
jgi:eukaryotic-like serine/threonine-protein kinase